MFVSDSMCMFVSVCVCFQGTFKGVEPGNLGVAELFVSSPIGFRQNLRCLRCTFNYILTFPCHILPLSCAFPSLREYYKCAQKFIDSEVDLRA